ncbi:MAG: SDR family NAD(P)-dependent oxidoreductase [Pseudomonadota bacterium]
MTSPKTILITGATDGIGLEATKLLSQAGHRVLMHGRNAAKLAEAATAAGGAAGTVQADLSRMDEVAAMADEVAARQDRLDVLINNAGMLKTPQTVTDDGLDIRFAVNTLAPYLLTRRLLPLMGIDGRVINVSSAAQAPVDPAALAGQKTGLADMAAYSQSKLAITAWSFHMARELGTGGPAIIAVNPGSLLASKMVKEGFGIAGNDLAIGAKILVRAALDPDFANATGKYFDNDAGRFGPPHAHAHNPDKAAAIVKAIEDRLSA